MCVYIFYVSMQYALKLNGILTNLIYEDSGTTLLESISEMGA